MTIGGRQKVLTVLINPQLAQLDHFNHFKRRSPCGASRAYMMLIRFTITIGKEERMATKPKRTAAETLQDTIRTILESNPTLGKSWKRGMLRYYFMRYSEVCFTDAGIEEVSEDMIEITSLRMLESALDGLDGWQSYVQELIQNGNTSRTA